VPAANGGVRSPSLPAADKVGSARFFADIFGLPFDASSCHFAPVWVSDSLTFPFDGDASPDRGFSPRSALNRVRHTNFFSLALTVHVGLAYTKHARNRAMHLSEVAQRRLLHRAPSQGRI
jgi:hypothetical protein